MVCPCCGGEMSPDGLSCACGARVVGHPLTEPEYVIPQVGGPIFALVLTFLSITAIIWKWTLLLAIAAIWISRGALKKIKKDPSHYGGRRIAITATTLSAFIILGVTIYVCAGIPKYLKFRAESQRAATRAQMYRVAIALHDYKRKHGAYPISLNALKLELDEPMVLMDFWENSLKYQATTEVAADSLSEANPSTGLAAFNQYQLVSPGPDGKLGTGDDVVMRDDIIISPTKSHITADEESSEE